MAWHYARYVQAVAAKGKAAYPLPMYVNTWLGGNDAIPGNYPSGGPQPRVLDIWKAAAPSIDIIAPDLYASNFAWWASRYHRPDNPLWLPETNGGTAGAANVFYAIGEHAAIGFSPFGIDSDRDTVNDLGQSYSVLASIAPLILDAQSKAAIHGFLLTEAHPAVDFTLNGYIVHVSLDEIFGHHADSGYGLIMADGPDAFLGAGKGFRVSFTSRSLATHVGLASVDEGAFADGKWTPGRRLNGDENDQGTYWRFDPRYTKIEKASVYQFQ